MTSYEPGTPNWVDIGVADIAAAGAFYGALLGWEVVPGPAETGGYASCRLRGRPVAGIGPQQNPGPPVWTSYIAVADVDAAAAAVADHGGTVVVPPMDVMDLGRMAVFTDNVGAFFSVWRAGNHIGAEVVNEPGAWCWNELTTRDPDAAKAFYGPIFGWTWVDHPQGESTYTEWKLADRPIAGMMPMVGPQWPAELPNHWMVYFAVEDCDASAARVTELGGTVMVPPFDIPQGRVAVVNAPDGAAFSLIAPNPMPTA
jgi:predicted enzyme related to lactoylglutathione lyase